MRNFLAACLIGLGGLAGFFANDIYAAMTKLSARQGIPSSVADAKCAPLWVDKARNDPALSCYLTSSIERLCDPVERKHLAWIVERYQADQVAFNATAWGAAIRLQRVAIGGDAAARNQARREEKRRLVEQGFDKALAIETVLDEDLTAMLRVLAERGYIERRDFGWYAPAFVKEAFEDLAKPMKACERQ